MYVLMMGISVAFTAAVLKRSYSRYPLETLLETVMGMPGRDSLMTVYACSSWAGFA